MEGTSSTGQGRQSSVTSLTDLASTSSGGQPPAAAGAASASASSGGSGGAANAGAATATLTITEEGTQDVPQEQVLRLSLAPRPRVTWCVCIVLRFGLWSGGETSAGLLEVASKVIRLRQSVVPFFEASVRTISGLSRESMPRFVFW